MTLRTRAAYAVRSVLAPKGLGYLGDPKDDRDRPFDALGLPSSDLPGTCLPLPDDLEYRYRLHQGSSNTCVAQALCGALFNQALVHALRHGSTVDELLAVPAKPLQSRSFVYRNSFLYNGLPVRDRGTYIRAACEAHRRLGAPDEGVWAFRPADVLREPSPAARAAGFARRLGDYHRIWDRGSALILALRAAIASDLFPVFGIDWPQSMMGDVGPSQVTVPDPNDPIIGGHALHATGYRRRSNGQTEFWVVNSYGRGWRDGGGFWMHEDWMRQARDVWTVRARNA